MGEAQFLELFDGGGGTSIRVDETRHYERSHVSLFRDEANRRLGLQKGFKEILEMIDGDPFVRIDGLASHLQG